MHGSASNGLEMFRRDMQIIICDPGAQKQSQVAGVYL